MSKEIIKMIQEILDGYDRRVSFPSVEGTFVDMVTLKKNIEKMVKAEQTAEEIVFGRHESIGRVVEFLDCPPDELTRKVTAFPASFNYWKNKFVRIFRKIDEEPEQTAEEIVFKRHASIRTLIKLIDSPPLDHKPGDVDHLLQVLFWANKAMEVFKKFNGPEQTEKVKTMEEETTDYKFENVMKEEAGVSLICVTMPLEGYPNVFYKIIDGYAVFRGQSSDYKDALGEYNIAVEAAKRPKCGLCKENKVSGLASESWRVEWDFCDKIGLDMKFFKCGSSGDSPLAVCVSCKGSIEDAIQTKMYNLVQKGEGGLND